MHARHAICCPTPPPALHCSINGKFKLTLHKKAALPVVVQQLTHPLIENAESFVIQGYTYADYLEELPDPMSTIYSKSDLDMAMTVACEWPAGRAAGRLWGAGDDVASCGALWGPGG